MNRQQRRAMRRQSGLPVPPMAVGQRPVLPIPGRAPASVVASPRVTAGVSGSSRGIDEREVLAEAARAFRAGDRESAEAAAWRIVRHERGAITPAPLTPDETAHTLWTLAKALYLAVDYLGAAEVLAEAMPALAQAAEAHVLDARIGLGLGHMEEALAAARRAARLGPALPPAHEALADVLGEMGRPEDAARALERAIKANPRNPAFPALLGRVKRDAGALEEALYWYRAALALGPANAIEIHYRTGAILHDRGEFDAAIVAFRQVLALNPRLGEAYAAWINSLHAAGRAAEAVAVHERAKEAVPGYERRFLDFHFPVRQDDAAAARGPWRMEARRALLVNGAGTMPGVPLGIACIKANVEGNSDFRVTCVDVSARLAQDIVAAFRDGSTALTFDDEAEFVAAVDAIGKVGPGFYEIEAFQRHSALFNTYNSFFNSVVSRQCARACTEGAPTPWYVIEYARLLLSKGPSVIGFSIMFTEQMEFTFLLARAVKILNPAVTVVFGGCFFNRANLEGFLTRPYVDYVILFEGEQSFLDFLNAREGQGEIDAISGIAYRKADGTFVLRENAFAIKHDLLPFADFSDFDLGAYFTPEPVLPLISSRGCYWRRCTFCDHFASYAGTYKTQSIDRVVAEIEHHVRTSGVRHFSFVDEMISAKRFKKISEEILARGLEVYYYALAKPTADFDQDILDLMYRAGCRCIYWGLESGSERMLAMMDKGNTVESSTETLERAHRAGIKNHVFLIIGFPTESRADLRMTIDFLHRNRAHVDKLIASPYVMNQGTPLHDQFEKFGIRKIYRRRTLCNHALIDFDLETGIASPDAHRIAEILENNFFRHFSQMGPHFGRPRDQVIVMYSNAEAGASRRRDDDKPMPTPDEIDAMLDGRAPFEKAVTERTVYPRWNVARIAAGPA